ncbi:isoaspartyl peptidase/L-asparaginase family protein [Aliikangiella sp. IMCC44653]
MQTRQPTIISVFFFGLLSLVAATTAATTPATPAKPEKSQANKVSIAIHGGAGNIIKAKMSPELQKAYHQALREALSTGHQILMQGGTSTQAVAAAIVSMENSPLFNAGKGAVYTHDKTIELDASIMRGEDLNAGAVSGVSKIKNPIKLAIEIMQNSKHVMLSGKGAEAFAVQQNLEMASPEYFKTKRRWQQIINLLKQSDTHTVLSNKDVHKQANHSQWPDDEKFGTVGAVAYDVYGNLAAGTSTGGMTNKRFGRIGDAPIIGAGTYADNSACAISATGHGEYFIRAAVAHDICARTLYKNMPLQQAADEVIQQKLVKMGGEGGIIGLTSDGKPIFSFNSSGMYRGYIDQDGKIYTAIFKSNPN